MIVTGIGGTGVVTVGAILGMAARLQGCGASLYDMTGLSQKGGAVFSHIRLSAQPDAVVSARVGPGESDLVLACDLIAAAHPEVISTVRRGHTLIVGNTDIMATADFQVHRDLEIPRDRLLEKLTALGGTAPRLLGASRLAESVFGDSIAANIIMLGFAWQCGGIPLARAAIEQAIRLNGRAVEANLRAFRAGRARAVKESGDAVPVEDLDTFIERRTRDLEAYWNRSYGERYENLLRTLRKAAHSLEGGEKLAWMVARSAYRLMAYKDEYEVARLYSNGQFRAALSRELDGVRTITIQLAPPLFARKDPTTGRPRKISVGGWIFPVFRALAACRGLREGPLDLFGRTAERRLEREIRDLFIERMTSLTAALRQDDIQAAIELAESALQVRGFGLIKEPAARALRTRLQTLRQVRPA